MRLLVIAQHIGHTAPGKVFEALVGELSRQATVDVITCHYQPSAPIAGINRLIEIEEPSFINPRFTAYADRLFNICFGIAWRDWVIGRNTPPLSADYDAVIALGSAHNLSPLQVGRIIHKRQGIPLYVYLVDACPVPAWWGTSADAGGIRRFLKRLSPGVAYFASSNPQMLDYQKQFLTDEISKLDVLFTPSLQMPRNFPDPAAGAPVFVYLGSLYGLRTPKHILEAFGRFVKDCPEARLMFVGTNASVMDYVPAELLQNVEIKPFTDNPERYFQAATGLIDIDAEVDNDVFLSSKFTNYVFVNRPIVCQTGAGSPVRNLVDGYRSIIICSHNAQQLYEALKKCMTTKFDYSERAHLRMLFSPKYNAEKILKAIKNQTEK